eukprot:532321-Pyramimonas_sp.AAC.1
MEYRISQAWKSRFKWRSVVCQHHAPLEKRLLLCDSVVRSSSLFWGAKRWNLRKDQYAKLRGLQDTLHRRVFGFRKVSHEPWGAFMVRTYGKINDVRKKLGILDWD